MNAIITGASSGIGRELALQLAARCQKILCIARNQERLDALAQECQRLNPSLKVSTLALDLCVANAPGKIVEWVETHQFAPTILINNAGYGVWGPFATSSLEEQLDMMHLNMDGVVSLTLRLIPFLKKSPKAYIMNVGSTTAYQAMPTFSTYAASKSFVQSFTRALHHEHKNSSISVTLLTPGATESAFMQRAGLAHLAEKAKKFNMQADVVARQALEGMFQGKIEVVPGLMNLVSTKMIRFIPRKIIEKIVSGIYQN